MFDEIISNRASYVNSLKDKLSKLYPKVRELRYLKGRLKSLKKRSLMSLIQSIASSNNFGDRVVVLRSAFVTGVKEAVKVRIEKLTLKEFVSFLKELDGYYDVDIYSIAVSKDFANKRRINIDVTVVKR